MLSVPGRVKILYWEDTGYALWYKRLEAGTFRFPAAAREVQSSLTISAADLAMLLDGVDLASVKRDRLTPPKNFFLRVKPSARSAG